MAHVGMGIFSSCDGRAGAALDTNSQFHLAEPDLLQVIIQLSSCLVQSCFPSLQVNKAFKSTQIQLLFLPYVPGLSLINPIPGKWKTELFSAFGAFQPRSFHSFFPKGSKGQEPGLLLPLLWRGRDSQRKGH